MIGANIKVFNVTRGVPGSQENRIPAVITVTGTGTSADRDYPYVGIVNGKHSWNDITFGDQDNQITWDGANWELNSVDALDTWVHATGTDDYPDKTGWPTSTFNAYPAPTLAYSGWVGIDENPENGTTYAPESFTDNGDGTATIITTDNSGGGFTFRDGASAPPFDNNSGKTYEVRYRLTGSSTTAIRIRSVSGTDGNAANTDSNLNIASATIDGAWHTVQFTANGATDSYLQVGASITGNFNLLVEVLVKRIL